MVKPLQPSHNRPYLFHLRFSSGVLTGSPPLPIAPVTSLWSYLIDVPLYLLWPSIRYRSMVALWWIILLVDRNFQHCPVTNDTGRFSPFVPRQSNSILAISFCPSLSRKHGANVLECMCHVDGISSSPSFTLSFVYEGTRDSADYL